MTFQEAIDIFAHDGIFHLASRERKENLDKLLSVPFDPEIHYSLAYIHIHFVMLNEAERILEYTPDKEDETYKQLKDYYDALAECDRVDIGIFPLSVSYRDWWKGPHLDFPPGFTDWYPIRMDCIDDKSACITVGKLENGEITYGYVDFITKEFIENSLDEFSTDSMGEMAYYENTGYKFRFHQSKIWNRPPELDVVAQRVQPLIQKSHDLLTEAIAKDFDKNDY
jgi:hypothetical protein